MQPHLDHVAVARSGLGGTFGDKCHTDPPRSRSMSDLCECARLLPSPRERAAGVTGGAARAPERVRGHTALCLLCVTHDFGRLLRGPAGGAGWWGRLVGGCRPSHPSHRLPPPSPRTRAVALAVIFGAGLDDGCRANARCLPSRRVASSRLVCLPPRRTMRSNVDRRGCVDCRHPSGCLIPTQPPGSPSYPRPVFARPRRSLRTSRGYGAAAGWTGS